MVWAQILFVGPHHVIFKFCFGNDKNGNCNCLQIEDALGKDVQEFYVISHKTQVVAGIMYYVKVRIYIGVNNDKLKRYYKWKNVKNRPLFRPKYLHNL